MKAGCLSSVSKVCHALRGRWLYSSSNRCFTPLKQRRFAKSIFASKMLSSCNMVWICQCLHTRTHTQVNIYPHLKWSYIHPRMLYSIETDRLGIYNYIEKYIYNIHKNISKYHNYIATGIWFSPQEPVVFSHVFFWESQHHPRPSWRRPWSRWNSSWTPKNARNCPQRSIIATTTSSA